MTTTTVTPFLMFQGKAEEAMRLYTSLFANASIVEIERFGAGEPGAEGTVKKGAFVIGDRRFMCLDSPVKHAFGFTPALSLFVAGLSEPEVDRVFGALAEGGQVLMPLGTYPFSARFGWVNDRFGVSWQISA